MKVNGLNKKIKKNDVVIVVAGKDKGKTGKVIEIKTDKNRAVVAGVNYVKKHAKPTKKNDKGGITSKESPIDLSNIMLFCNSCNKAVRVGSSILKDGSKVRQCKKCGQEIGR